MTGFAVAFACAVPALAQTARPLGLDEAYRLALARSETLVRSSAAVREAEARLKELRGALLPDLELRGSELLQDSAGGSGQTGVGQTFTRTSRPEARLNLQQTLFTGLRELLALRAAKSLKSAASWRLERARSELYLDVAATWLEVFRLREQARTLEQIAKLIDDRTQDLEKRERVGRSRRSEVLAARFQAASTRAEIEQVNSRERSAQEALRFLTGLDGNLDPVAPPSPGPEPLEPFLERTHSRPDVGAARDALSAARLEAELAARERWPTVDFEGNYYLYRAGFQKPIKWDLSLTASLPLYAGGAIGARVEAGEARIAAAKADLEEAERTAAREVRTAHARLESALAVARSLQQARDLAEANADAQAEDYRRGLVNNLEVLQSLTELQRARIQLDAAELDAALARAQLEVAAGGPAKTEP